MAGKGKKNFNIERITGYDIVRSDSLQRAQEQIRKNYQESKKKK